MTQQLEYAPPQKWHQRRRFRRAVFWFILLAACAAAAWKFGPPVYDKCRMLYLQRQCLNHAVPPGMTPISPPTALPPEFDSLRAYMSEPLLDPAVYGRFDGIALLHSRTSPGGERLICAYLYRASSGITMVYVFVIEPGTFSRPPKIVSDGGVGFPFQLTEYRVELDPTSDAKFVVTGVDSSVSPPQTARLFCELRGNRNIFISAW